jgi:hypothetical protein
MAGQGKKNGRLYIGHGAIDPATVPSLSDVRRSRTSSNPGVETRPSPSLGALAEVQVCLSRSTSLHHTSGTLITLQCQNIGSVGRTDPTARGGPGRS